MNTKTIGMVCAILALIVAPAWADWKPGDPYKMHYPQLPDPSGWDVAFTNTLLGDDWRCTETGLVTDIHLWVSFRDDLAPGPGGWVQGQVEIWSDVPAGEDANFSHPGEQLWKLLVDTRMPNVKARLWPDTLPVQQGWLDPTIPLVLPADHNQTYQINIDPANPAGTAPFVQKEGTMYWLVAKLTVMDPAGPALKEIGWKTSLSQQFRDDAVFQSPLGIPPLWRPLEDPRTGQSLDLAFVITGIPEPATLGLAVVAIAMMVYKRNR